MKFLKKISVLFLFSISASLFAQSGDGQKIYASGYARATYRNQDIDVNSTAPDTVTANRLNSGHVLTDIAANIRPNKVTEILAMVRVRNDFGGFYGSGVTFDVRQLYLKGIAGGKIRYQLGDFNYKLTPYTFYNSTEDLRLYEPKLFRVYRDMIHQDYFYNFDNSWRQQGGAVDFGFQFGKYIKAIDFSLFTSNINVTGADGGLDRVMAGGTAKITQSDRLQFAVNYVNMFDLVGTSEDNTALRNPVLTGSVYFKALETDGFKLSLRSETGTSRQFVKNDSITPDIDDFFVDARLSAELKDYNLKMEAGYVEVGANFRSPGAQTKRIDYNSRPRAFSFYGNDQFERPITILDLTQDASLYNLRLRSNLMAFNPSYNNSTPYGYATPNRRGVVANISHTDDQKRWELKAGALLSSEISGTGSTDLKNFTKLFGEAVIHVNKFIGFERVFDIDAGYWNETTTRDQSTPVDGVQNVDLNSSMLNIGVTFEFVDKLELLLAYRGLTSDGVDYLEQRNSLGVVSGFSLYNVDLSETMYGAGINYVITDDINLAVLYHNYTWDDSLRDAPEYSIGQGSINYIMKF